MNVMVTVGADGDGELRETVVDDPNQTYKKIRSLNPNSTYAVSIVALTDAGRGPEVSVNAYTVPVSGAVCVLQLKRRSRIPIL